jgi:small-conductance mechanosensitive channel
MENLQHIQNLFAEQLHTKYLKAILIFLAGIIIIRLVSYLLSIVLKTLTPQHQFVIKKISVYSLDALLIVVILSFIGIDLTAILGTVGIVGIIIGIASQSAIGNIISGIFLLSERAFQIGDIIRLDTQTGEVFSIDLLSIRIKTFDNQLIRIPNQMLLNSRLTNISRFPVRRLDIEITISLDTDLSLIEPILKKIYRSTPGSLVNPEALITFKEFTTNGVVVIFGVWFERNNLLKLKNNLYPRIQQEFRAAGIKIPTTRIEIIPESHPSQN